MVAPIVESAVPPATLSHPYSYVGLVLSMHTSAADVVVRGFTQMGGHPQLHECDVSALQACRALLHVRRSPIVFSDPALVHWSAMFTR